MKVEIQPKYEKTTVRCACGAEFETRSTKENIRLDIEKNPQDYTPWFKIAFAELLKHYNK